MKKIISIYLVFILALSLSSCASVDLTTTDKIEPPSGSMIIEGEWKVKEYKMALNYSVGEDVAKKYIGKSAMFNKNNAVILDEQCVSPRYKVKNINALEYFYYNYKVNPEIIDIKQKSVQVVTISSNKNFFMDIIRLDDNTLVTYVEGIFLFYKNESKTITDDKNDKKQEELIDTKNKNLDSGLLLALKYYENAKGKSKESDIEPLLKPKYRTVWISLNDTINPIDQIPVILLPRKSGFWIVDVKQNKSRNYIYDYLFAYPIANKTDNTLNTDQNNDFNRSININFIGNDFISMESIQENIERSKVLKMLPVDALYVKEEKSIKISELMGIKGVETLKIGSNVLMSTFNESDKKRINNTPDETSFSILRESGRWIVKGRLYNSSEVTKDYYMDFDIPIIPPKSLVAYDTLYPVWNIIKQKVPSAVDAYSSPNKNIAVVLTKDKLLVYGVKENKLKDKPEAEISLKNNETVIMAQWATGEYVKSWSEQVKALKVKN